MHKHVWKKHIIPGAPLICECGARKLNKDMYHRGKTKLVSFRLDLARFEKLRRNGIDVRRVMENFIDGF